jgi:beta-ribofuranosylaminobenzene 5'-phosphate synthase
MSEFRIVAPSRLHFGLLAWGAEAPRQFGSVGLMIDGPGLAIEARPASAWSASGPIADRAVSVMNRVVRVLRTEAIEPSPLHLSIQYAPPEHVGLGTGTQLSLAVARLVLAHAGEFQPSLPRLAVLTGRGRRSGIGLHGFERGGLLVDGGRSAESMIPPLLARLEFPPEWSILVVIPPTGPGFSGRSEREAFARLPDVPSRTIDRLCRLVLLGLLPAVAEKDLPAFGAALTELQLEVGRLFAPAQGGLFADPRLDSIANAMRDLGLRGVGQSSWGPTLYGFLAEDTRRQEFLSQSLTDQFSLDPGTIRWAHASQTGARFESFESE